MAFLVFFGAVFAGLTLAQDDEGLSSMRLPFERGSAVPPAVSVFYDLDYSGVGNQLPQRVIACIWPDGRAVWSGNRSEGGPPYFTGYVDPKRLREFMAIFDARGLFQRKVWFSQAVDAPHHDIHIIDGQRHVALCASAGYSMDIQTPFLIHKVEHALACFRQQLEQLLPREGKPLSTFDYELHRLP
ncbi:MAG: hypothetical protein ABJF10_24675 [Chthoniobacter sp.]|uniref:hypothetical protein n=1 Tax=Chthoniobacter sp. TaxID=2510640 RepID=UPI0032A9EF5D